MLLNQAILPRFQVPNSTSPSCTDDLSTDLSAQDKLTLMSTVYSISSEMRLTENVVTGHKNILDTKSISVKRQN